MDGLAMLVAKEEIRDLAMLYARGIDRKDTALLRSLYTADGIDRHGRHYSGPVDGYIAFLDQSLPHLHIGGHYMCHHLIDIAGTQDGDEGEGEVYAIAWHVFPDGKSGLVHDVQGVRYLDRYRREDGRWLFASRVLVFDMKLGVPAEDYGEKPDPQADSSYALLAPLFARGGRT